MRSFKTIKCVNFFRPKYFYLPPPINRPWSHVWVAIQNLGRIDSVVLTFIGYKQTTRQTHRQEKFIYVYVNAFSLARKAKKNSRPSHLEILVLLWNSKKSVKKVSIELNFWSSMSFKIFTFFTRIFNNYYYRMRQIISNS